MSLFSQLPSFHIKSLSSRKSTMSIHRLAVISVWLSSSLSVRAASCASGRIVRCVASDWSVLHSPCPSVLSFFCNCWTKFWKIREKIQDTRKFQIVGKRDSKFYLTYDVSVGSSYLVEVSVLLLSHLRSVSSGNTSGGWSRLFSSSCYWNRLTFNVVMV